MKIAATTTERLNQLLKDKGITQADVCRRTNIPSSTLSRYVSGHREMVLDSAKAIAKAYNINPAWLMGFDVPETQPPKEPEENNTENNEIKSQLREKMENMSADQLEQLLKYARFIESEGK